MEVILSSSQFSRKSYLFPPQVYPTLIQASQYLSSSLRSRRCSQVSSLAFSSKSKLAFFSLSVHGLLVSFAFLSRTHFFVRFCYFTLFRSLILVLKKAKPNSVSSLFLDSHSVLYVKVLCSRAISFTLQIPFLSHFSIPPRHSYGLLNVSLSFFCHGRY